MTALQAWQKMNRFVALWARNEWGQELSALYVELSAHPDYRVSVEERICDTLKFGP